MLSIRNLFCLALMACIGCSSATNSESVPTQKAGDAANKNPREPGPTDKDAPEEFTTTDSGLKYRVLRKSESLVPTSRDTVTVQYRGWLDDGTIFDQSYGPNGQPASFGLKNVIKGWTEGLQHVAKGGKIELEIPPSLGYAEKGFGKAVPPDATLHFIVELLDIERGPKPLTPGRVDDDAPEEFTTNPSGLKYRIRRKSEGQKPAPGNIVVVNYKGWLDDGTEFDNSYERAKPLNAHMDHVIKGWTEGLQLIGRGGMIELVIPNEMGYGHGGDGSRIPPNATLHYLVELLDIKKAP